MKTPTILTILFFILTFPLLTSAAVGSASKIAKDGSTAALQGSDLIQKDNSQTIADNQEPEPDTNSSSSQPIPLDEKIKEIYNNIVVYLAGPLAILFLIYGGYLYITSTGNPEQVGMAKDVIMTALTAVIVLLLAGLILNTIGQTPVPEPQSQSGDQSQQESSQGDGS